MSQQQQQNPDGGAAAMTIAQVAQALMPTAGPAIEAAVNIPNIDTIQPQDTNAIIQNFMASVTAMLQTNQGDLELGQFAQSLPGFITAAFQTTIDAKASAASLDAIVPTVHPPPEPPAPDVD